VDNQFITLSEADWTDEGQVIDPKVGEFLYNTYCSSCHGAKGAGLDPQKLPAGVPFPAPFAQNMPHSYVYQTIWRGAPKSLMPSFRGLLSPGDIWDITVYLLGDQPSSSVTGGG